MIFHILSSKNYAIWLIFEIYNIGAPRIRTWRTSPRMEVPLAISYTSEILFGVILKYLTLMNCLVAKCIVGESHHRSNSYIFRPNFSLALLLKLCTVYLSTAFKNLLISIDRDPRYRTVVVVGHSYISRYLLAGPVSSISSRPQSA